MTVPCASYDGVVLCACLGGRGGEGQSALCIVLRLRIVWLYLAHRRKTEHYVTVPCASHYEGRVVCDRTLCIIRRCSIVCLPGWKGWGWPVCLVLTSQSWRAASLHHCFHASQCLNVRLWKITDICSISFSKTFTTVELNTAGKQRGREKRGGGTQTTIHSDSSVHQTNKNKTLQERGQILVH